MRVRSGLLALAICLWSAPVSAQIAFNTADYGESAPGATNRTISAFTPTGDPRGVIVFTVQTTGTDEISGCTYGGDAMTPVTGSPLVNPGEAGTIEAYTLGTSIPTGTVDITCTASATVNTKIVYLFVMTAGDDTETVDTDASMNSSSQADPTVSMSLAGRTSFVALIGWSGQNDPTGVTQFSGWTLRDETDAGSQIALVYSYDTVAGSDVNAGWTQTASAASMLVVAMAQLAGAAPDYPANGNALLGVGR